MESASTINKRRSLTLSSRLLQKRHSASPQGQSIRASAAQETTKEAVDPGSPTRNISDNVESTPPNKMAYSLDDSLDFSPRNNLSPSCLFSQTLVTGSPEVSWRWNRDNNARGDKINTTSDSGFDSEEIGLCANKQQRDRRKQFRVDATSDYRRTHSDNRQWRAQQIRNHQLLKERCDKLNMQLDQQAAATSVPLVVPVPETVASDAALADFLNDSVTDCFLLEASQQLESKLEPQEPLKEVDRQCLKELPSRPLKQAPAATTPTSHHKTNKEKRSSFYMQFLEDESESEDWFLALDEAMLEASQPKKPRTSLHRYNSMPNNTTAEANANNAAEHNSVATSSSGPNSATVVKTDTPRIKRHASSHVLSPATSSARGNLFGRRK